MSRIAIIIPVLNEASNLRVLLPYLKVETAGKNIPIVVADGGSQDNSIEIAKQYNAITLTTSKPSRAYQLNIGAHQIDAEILYFLHADVIPPKSFIEEISSALERGYVAGCFSYVFDKKSILLSINSWFTRFKHRAIGGGDQSLFITSTAFTELGGYDESLIIMEDFDLVHRIRKKYPFTLIKNPAKVSARKYERNGWLKVQVINTYIFLAYCLGASQKYLFNSYRKFLTE